MTYETPYIYKTKDLCEAMNTSRWTLILLEKKGRFTPPRAVNGHRIFTQEQIRDIVHAFSPGGEFQWHFDQNKDVREYYEGGDRTTHQA